MPIARLCPLTEVTALNPLGCGIAERLANNPNALDSEMVLHICSDVQLPELHLNAPLATGSALRTWLQRLPNDTSDTKLPSAPFLILIEGNLQVDGALTSNDTDGTTHLIVTGDTQAQNMVVAGQLLNVGGMLHVDDLLWGHGNHGELRVQGGLTARVAVFTDRYRPNIAGPEQVAFLLDEVRGVAHLAEFSCEVMAAVFDTEFLDDADTGAYGISALLNRDAVLAAVRAGDSATRSSADIHTLSPIAHDLCADNAISVENIMAVLRTPVIAHKQYKAYGWFQETDFSLCQRHVDEEQDQRDDNVFITVWKTWDFYLSVEQVPLPQGLMARLAAAVLRRTVPTSLQLTLIYRGYIDGEPGDWKALAPDTDPKAWKACQHAWRGVLDYVRKAVGQHRARYPLHQRLKAELTTARIETLTTLPVFTERYNDWWDSDKNGYWEDDIWVGARQPCMHDGEPWGRALKLSWKNGDTAPGDAADNAHSAYQLDVDEARDGPGVVDFTYSQRQSDSRTALPACAADHIARLLRFYGAMEARINTHQQQEQARQSEARRIEATVHLLTTPPLAPDLPDSAVFPVELMVLSGQWQADGERYVAAIRTHQFTLDAADRASADPGAPERSDDDAEEKSEEEAENELPEDPRKASAPTVLQLARVVSAWGDEDLSERFRQRFAFAADAFAPHAAHAGRFIGPVFELDDGRVLACIGAPYEDAAHWVALHGGHAKPLPALKGLGRSSDRSCFAQSDGQHITTHRGFDGPVVARFALPRGNEDLPPALEIVADPLGQRSDELIPFDNGQRVLLRNPTGIYLLGEHGVQRLHPQTFDEDGPYNWPKNQSDEDRGAALSLNMLHMALS
ncbi:MAG: WD40 repeat domain-containing protein, partial [Gammaproteobacteria bacterium]|nr:WD40 repeat domain-containing protein [Gammaproteobacteria bacterium]